MKSDELKQVILVRKDLKMPKGKLAVQVAHASVEAVLHSPKKIVKKWKAKGMKKVCLKVEKLEDLYSYVEEAKLSSIKTSIITDVGKTVFKKPTVTCAAIGPYNSEEIDIITGELKIL